MLEWTTEEIQLLEKNINKPLKAVCEAFAKVGFSRSSKAISRKKEKMQVSNTLVSMATEHRGEFKADTITTGTISKEVVESKALPTSNEVIEEFFELVDKENGKKANTEARIDSTKERVVAYRSKAKNQRYVHLCDLHIPFQLDEVDEIVSREADLETILILNGDTLDCFDVSIFPKAYSVGLKNEVDILKAKLRDWSKRFKAIYITQGNHEHRLSSFLRKKISGDVISLISDDIIEIILNDLKIDNIFYRKGDRNNWYIQVDNVIIAHPVDYKGGILNTSLLMMNYFDARNTTANVFMIGHTHALGKAVYKGRTLVEGGCLCKEPDYALSGKLTYMPQTNGYIVFTSRNANVSFNDIELIVV